MIQRSRLWQNAQHRLDLILNFELKSNKMNKLLLLLILTYVSSHEIVELTDANFEHDT